MLALCGLATVAGCITGDKGDHVTYDNRRGGTVLFVAELQDGERIELASVTVEDGGALIPADHRVFDDDNCSTRPIEAQTPEGNVLAEFPIGTCHAFVIE